MRFSHRFQPGTHLRAWLFQILRNTFLTFYRLREREAALSEDGVPEGGAPMFHDAPGRGRSSTEVHTDLDRALSRLPEEFKTPLLLAEVEGLPLEEVARIMDCPVGTVKSRIFRAKERLRDPSQGLRTATEERAERHGDEIPGGPPIGDAIGW